MMDSEVLRVKTLHILYFFQIFYLASLILYILVKEIFMNNRNTTIAGIGAILVAVGGVLTAIFDGDVATNADFASAIAAVIAGIGLIFAKDAKTPPTV
jgi:hypothetical protein